MHYKLIKTTHTTVCDEEINNFENKINILKSIIAANINVSMSYYCEEIDRVLNKDKVKIKNIIDNQRIKINVQKKQMSFIFEINISDIKSIFVHSEKNVIKIDESNTRYEFLDLN